LFANNTSKIIYFILLIINKLMADKFDKKELLNWIETQPDLKFIREQANRTFVSYDTSEKDLNKRISLLGTK
mgnify:CR=1